MKIILEFENIPYHTAFDQPSFVVEIGNEVIFHFVSLRRFGFPDFGTILMSRCHCSVVGQALGTFLNPKWQCLGKPAGERAIA